MKHILQMILAFYDFSLLSINQLLSFHWDESVYSLQYRHNGCEGVSNHQPHHCLLNRLIRSKKKSKLLPLCGEFAGGGEFPVQKASNAKNISI